MAQVTLGGLAAGMLVGVLLPWRWSVALGAIASIGYTVVFIAQTPGHHPVIAVAFLFLFIVVPQIVAPVWFGLASGFAIRYWTKGRLALRIVATLAAASLIAVLHQYLQADPKWKQATEKDAATFVRGHSDVAAKLGVIQGLNPISMRLGDRLPYSQIEYFVRGTNRNALVVVEISGDRKKPTFRVVSIKDQK